MAIQININGSMQEVTQEQLFSLARQNIITPDTVVIVNGKQYLAKSAKGIVFGNPQTTDTVERINEQTNVSSQRDSAIPQSNKEYEEEYEIAGSGRRFIAFLLDVAVCIVILFISTLIVIFTSGGIDALDNEALNIRSWGLFFIFTLPFYVYFLYKSTSFGKSRLNLVVIDHRTMKPLGSGNMLIRDIVKLLLFNNPLFILLGFRGIQFIERNRQGWHDKVFDSIVVKRNPVEQVPPRKVLIVLILLVMVGGVIHRVGDHRESNTSHTAQVPANEQGKILEVLTSSYLDIFEAAEQGNVNDIRYFIEHGAGVNVKDEEGLTPLHLAANKNSNPEVLKFLVKHGADVNAKAVGGMTPLHAASVNNPNVEVVKFLIEQDADVNAKYGNDSTPLHLAAKSNPNVEVLKFLVEHATDVDAKTDEGGTPLYLSLLNNPNMDVLKVLVKRGADVNAKDVKGGTPLHAAVVNDPNVEVLRFLIQRDADVNAKADGGLTPLHAALLKNPNVEVLKVLIEHGAEVNATLLSKNTPLHIYLLFNDHQDMSVVKCLVEAGANIHVKNSDGQTPLDFVNEGSDVEIYLNSRK